MAFYRFTRACRQVIINYLKEELGEGTKHWDGSDWVELPAIQVTDVDNYNPMQLPVIITDVVTGTTKTISFSQQLTQWTDTAGLYGPKNTTYQAFGGRGDFDINLHCYAFDHETMELLTDIAAFEMVIGMGWIYFNRHIFYREVRFAGDSVDKTNPQTPIYMGHLTVPASADWRLIIPKETVSRINPDFDLVTPDDPFTDPQYIKPGLITPLDPASKPITGDMDKFVVIRTDQGELKQLKEEGPDSVKLPLRPMRSKR